MTPSARPAAIHLAWFYLFLYLPIAVLVVLSFNQAGLPTAWTGFSTEWYGKLAGNPAILRATLNTPDRRGFRDAASPPCSARPGARHRGAPPGKRRSSTR